MVEGIYRRLPWRCSTYSIIKGSGETFNCLVSGEFRVHPQDRTAKCMPDKRVGPEVSNKRWLVFDLEKHGCHSIMLESCRPKCLRHRRPKPRGGHIVSRFRHLPERQPDLRWRLFPRIIWLCHPLPKQRAFHGVFAALARKILGLAHLASPPFQRLRANMPAEPCHQLSVQTAAHLSVHHSPFCFCEVKGSSCVAANCYCESADLSHKVSKALA